MTETNVFRSSAAEQSAEQCLAGADLAGDDDQRLAPLERVGDFRRRGSV